MGFVDCSIALESKFGEAPKLCSCPGIMNSGLRNVQLEGV